MNNGNQSDIVRFGFNVPQLVNLRFATPKMVNSKFGERAMFGLVDGRVMFLDPPVAESIEALSIQPGEDFYVCKRSTKDRGTYWDIWLAPDTEKLRSRRETGEGVEAPPPVEHNNTGNAPIQAARNGQEPALSIPALDSKWANHVREQCKTRLSLYHEMVSWAKANLEGMSRNEVRAILMNCLISAERMPRQ